MDSVSNWVGKVEEASTLVTSAPVRALAATLDRERPAPQTGDPLPPLWHWLFTMPIHPASALGADGHEKRGGFLPPVALPRRMYAGGGVEFIHPIRLGDQLNRLSTVAAVEAKTGKTGPLVFVKVRHEYRVGEVIALVETQDIVYRERDAAAAPPKTAPPRSGATWSREASANEVMLFRFSALTFNAHRIHYDHDFTTRVEGYPGLLVHAPLLAVLLADLVESNLPHAQLSRFAFRAVRPVFANDRFTVCGAAAAGSPMRLWIEDSDGYLAMEASADLNSI